MGTSKKGKEINNKLNNLSELTLENDIDLHLEEVEKKGKTKRNREK